MRRRLRRRIQSNNARTAPRHNSTPPTDTPIIALGDSPVLLAAPSGFDITEAVAAEEESLEVAELEGIVSKAVDKVPAIEVVASVAAAIVRDVEGILWVEG